MMDWEGQMKEWRFVHNFYVMSIILFSGIYKELGFHIFFFIHLAEFDGFGLTFLRLVFSF